MIAKTKSIKFNGLKVSPSKPTDDQLAKINRFTRRSFTAEELYIGQLRLAHNAVDRDNERFSEEVLQRFGATTVRKTMLFDHAKYDSRENAVGKFFDVEIEKMSLDHAVQEFGEELRLPKGVSEVMILSPWFYIPLEGVDKGTIVKIDAGIYDFASVGFRAENLVPVFDQEGDVQYCEYRGSGRNTEVTEGSLVYLGAQQGMSTKGLDDAPPKPEDKSNVLNGSDNVNEGGKYKMKDFVERLKKMFSRSFSEDEAALADEIKAMIDEKDGVIVEKDKKIVELSPLAADGKAFRDDLTGKYVAAKAKLGEVAETPEAQEKVKTVAAGYPMDFLKSEVDAIQKRVEEKFPADPQTKGDMRRDKSEDGGEKDWKKKNPLVPEEGKEGK